MSRKKLKRKNPKRNLEKQLAKAPELLNNGGYPEEWEFTGYNKAEWEKMQMLSEYR